MNCPGQCCAVFWLPYTPEKLREVAAAAGPGSDMPYVADMVIPLAPDEAKARADRFGMSWPALNIDDEHADQVYTCRHWDETTRRCTAYEQRPRLCRDYPYDNACVHCGARESEATQAEWRKIRARQDWKGWRWSTKLSGYVSRTETPAADWEPGAGWTWDGAVMRPSWDGGSWDHRVRRWRVKA